jgi:hypothetical protein
MRQVGLSSPIKREMPTPISALAPTAAASALLEAEGLISVELLSGLETYQWAHLLSKGLSIADANKLRDAVAATTARPIVVPNPASITFNVLAVLMGVVFAMPSAALGSINEFGPYDSSYGLSLTERFYAVFIPGAAYMILMVRAR